MVEKLNYNGRLIPESAYNPDSLQSRLAKVDKMLSNHLNKGVNSTMNPTLLENYRNERGQLCNDLGLSEDEKQRKKQLRTLRRRLDARKIPYDRSIRDDSSTTEGK